MRYAIVHRVRLAAAAPVWEHHCELRLAPATTPHQTVGAVTIVVEPKTAVRAHRDGFGNPVHAFDLIAPHAEARVTLQAEVEAGLSNPFDFVPVPPTGERAWIAASLHAQPRLWDYLLHRSAATPALAGELPRRDPTLPLLDALQHVVAWSAEAETAVARAHRLICLARAWGAPARFVRGYRDRGYADDGAEALHAWAEILVPGAGWRGLDPDTGLVTNDTYVTVACGRDALDCPPVRSSCKGGEAAVQETSAVEVRGQQ
ncbi:MAG: transglutaminase family protein [Candidatus Binatia bacterium]